MKHFTLFLRKGFTSALALALAMIVLGGGKSMAGDVLSISFENNNVPADWDNGGTYGGMAYNEYLTSDDGIYGKQTWSYSVITSKNKIVIEPGQKITLNASLYPSGATYPYLEIWYSSDGSSWKELKSWSSGFVFGSVDSYTYTVSDSKLQEGCYLQIRDKKVKIKSLEISASIPELSQITEDEAPGEFQSSTVSNLTVKYTAKAGWNTICMPIQLRTYGVNHLTSLFGNDWSAYTLSNYSEKILSFSRIAATGYIQANTPLLIYAPNASGSQVELNITDVAVTYSSNPNTTAGGVTFQGTYAPKAAGTLTGNYGVTSDGRIAKAGSGASLKGYRAYFTGVPAGSGIKGFVIDGEDATDIGLVQMVEGSDKPVYNMSGQKVQKAQRGIYIINGKKVVIK